MTSPIQLINVEKHSQVKIKSTTNYIHAKEQQVVPLIVHEFAMASAAMPVVFVKNSVNGEFQAVALLGLKPAENVFYSEDKWLGAYLPALITHHPFALVPSQNDENQLQVALKEDSYLVSHEEGEAIFDDKGNETDYMTKRKNALGQYFENTRVTDAFIKYLVEKNLLSQQQLSLKINNENMTIDGIYLVDEKALNELSNDDFLVLRQRGYLAPIYNHMNSLHQLRTIAQLKTQ